MKEKRLIDVDDLIDFINMGHLRNPLESCFSERDVVDMLESRPTVDAVPVVRCRDCKYHNKPPCPMRLSFNWTEDYDFCSYGEKRCDDAN